MEILNVVLFSKLFLKVMISFSFFCGIVIMVAPEAFKSIDDALQKEFG